MHFAWSNFHLYGKVVSHIPFPSSGSAYWYCLLAHDVRYSYHIHLLRIRVTVD